MVKIMEVGFDLTLDYLRKNVESQLLLNCHRFIIRAYFSRVVSIGLRKLLSFLGQISITLFTSMIVLC